MYQNKAADAWGVKDGVIYCKGSETDKSDLRADLITVDSFTNFEVSVDWKISQHRVTVASCTMSQKPTMRPISPVLNIS
jgi:hypothetical protein